MTNASAIKSIEQWHGCYEAPWKGLLMKEAFQHPAKISKALADRIYTHAVERGWIEPGGLVLDPFGGIGGTALWPVMNGVRWVGVELEPRFVELAEANFALWKNRWGHTPEWVEPVIVQGDSRRLGELLSESAGLIVSSPPYAESLQNDGQKRTQFSDGRERNNEPSWRGMDYGQSPGQLGAMKEGDAPDLIVSSPPYAETVKGEHRETETAEDTQALRKTAGGSLGQSLRHGGYGVSDGQLGALRIGEPLSLLVSSPPYSAGTVHSGCGIDLEKLTGNKPGPNTQAKAQGYGATEGQLGALPAGDTFWAAARTILEQVYAVLKPGGHAIWVCKRFVRKGKIVEFPQQWAALCELVGFKLVCWHHAMLVKHGGTQKLLDGGEEDLSKSRKSFFRRLAEKKGAPAIDWEDVICMEK